MDEVFTANRLLDEKANGLSRNYHGQTIHRSGLHRIGLKPKAVTRKGKGEWNQSYMEFLAEAEK